MSPGKKWPVEAGKVKETDSALEIPEGMQLCQHLDLTHYYGLGL